MEYSVSAVIDTETCIGCGQCVRLCPEETLGMVDDKARVVNDYCLNCGHCEAACPVQAITVRLLDDPHFNTLEVDNSWLKHGEGDTAELVRLMGSRRSCRHFKDRPVERELLEDLVTIAGTAPTGSNSQACRYTVLTGQDQVRRLGDNVTAFYARLNKLSAVKPLRKLLKLVGQPALEQYYTIYHDKMDALIRNWQAGTRDRLFHGTPALIVISTDDEATLPTEDVFLAAQSLMLAAHTMGLGTCVIGFATEAARRDKKTRELLRLPKNETAGATLAIGWPDEKYTRTIRRRKTDVRFL